MYCSELSSGVEVPFSCALLDGRLSVVSAGGVEALEAWLLMRWYLVSGRPTMRRSVAKAERAVESQKKLRQPWLGGGLVRFC